MIGNWLMKILPVILMALLIYAPAHGQRKQVDTSKRVTIHLINAPLSQLSSAIKQQTGYQFGYVVVKQQQPISFNGTSVSLGSVLNTITKDLQIGYELVEDYIVLTRAVKKPDTRPEEGENIFVKGEVLDEEGNPLQSVTVLNEATGKAVMSDSKGIFWLRYSAATRILTLTCAGYEAGTIKVTKDNLNPVISLKRSLLELDNIVILGYSKDSRRNMTAGVDKISGSDIPPVYSSNVISALQGRITGALVTESNGAPGSTPKIQIRGQQSIGDRPGVPNLPYNEPLILIDLVPFAAGIKPTSKLQSVAGNPDASGSVAGGINSLGSINPNDIESIEILKDADATAIYGSRGAHGVIHITTKKGVAGKVKIAVNLARGGAVTAILPKLLNTQQYVQMRRESITNAGQTVNATTAPELTKWDTTRYTNFSKEMLGGTARNTTLYFSATGGSRQLNFYAGAGYNEETTVLPVPLPNKRGSLHLNVNYRYKDRFSAQFSFLAGSVSNHLTILDPTTYIRLAPNAPSLMDASGNLVFSENGITFLNPLGVLRNSYSSRTYNTVAAMLLDYKLSQYFSFRTNIGFNYMHVNEFEALPIAATNPAIPTTGTAYSASNTYTSWVAEPQIMFADTNHVRTRKIGLMLGSTLYGQTNNWGTLYMTGFTSDASLHQPQAAAAITATNDENAYRYLGMFGRANLNIKDRFFVNITGRLDGSSRFGPENQFALYGSLATAWIFSQQKYLREHLRFLSHGKIRASIGTSGNDNPSGDYRYQDLWAPVTGEIPYGGINTLNPTALSNPYLGWERNLKMELGLDLELWKCLTLSAAWYRNRTSQQLLSVNLPTQTGFSLLRAVNYPATVQNTGIELNLQSRIKLNSHIRWTSQLLLTIPRNKLIAFKDLKNSVYSNSLLPGYSLTTQKALIYKGVNPATGLFDFVDLNKDGKISTPEDVAIIGNLDPTIYGGWMNQFRIGRFELTIAVDGIRKRAINPLFYIYNGTAAPGKPGRDQQSNQPSIVLDRWQQPGDRATVQKWTVATDINTPIANFKNSDALYADASYLRLRTVGVSWQLPPGILSKLKLTGTKFYVDAQNLFILTNYKGGDPTIQSTNALPSVRSIVAGLEITL